MPRCGCASDQCSCRIEPGSNVDVQGTGSQSNPYVISAQVTGGGGGGGAERLPGEIIAYVGAIPPDGWLTCDGSAVSRTVYADLFAVSGVAFGAGDGSTTFNLPNLEGAFPLGLSGAYPRGTSGGEEEVTLAEANLPAHTHSMTHDHPSATTSSSGIHDHELGRSLNDGGSPSTVREGEGTSKVLDRQMVESDGAHTHTLDVPNYVGNTGTTGSGSAVPIMPPHTAVHYIVKT